MKRIKDERTRIDGYPFSIGGAEFFNNRIYAEDYEWLQLAYLTDILSAEGWEAPEYAVKLEPPEADFQTYLDPSSTFRRVEVTQILRPVYRQKEFHRENAESGIIYRDCPEPDPKPWSNFLHVLRRKLMKPYAPGAWLLIYHNMGSSDFEDFTPWHKRVIGELRKWTSETDSTCDITQSRYQSIFVVNCSGTAAVRLYPHWDVVKEARFP